MKFFEIDFYISQFRSIQNDENVKFTFRNVRFKQDLNDINTNEFNRILLIRLFIHVFDHI